MLSQIIEVTKFYRKAVLSQPSHAIAYFGFKKMVYGLDVPSFCRHATFGNARIVAAANIKLKSSQRLDREISERLIVRNANKD